SHVLSSVTHSCLPFARDGHCWREHSTGHALSSHATFAPYLTVRTHTMPERRGDLGSAELERSGPNLAT
ncbi:MAG TPA: hypothetical protein VK427_11395, partial [Kofleriaceae bacterium]|nr:hypothetical protein [Kofleriaceae bacterium]